MEDFFFFATCMVLSKGFSSPEYYFGVKTNIFIGISHFMFAFIIRIISGYILLKHSTLKYTYLILRFMCHAFKAQDN